MFWKLNCCITSSNHFRWHREKSEDFIGIESDQEYHRLRQKRLQVPWKWKARSFKLWIDTHRVRLSIKTNASSLPKNG